MLAMSSLESNIANKSTIICLYRKSMSRFFRNNCLSAKNISLQK